MIVGHRYERSFGLVIVTQTDALAANPDFRTQERLIWQLEKLADFRPRELVLQSWHEGGIPSLAVSRRWEGVLETELAERKALSWPPFVRLVKVSYAHADSAAARKLAKLAADRLQRAVSHLKLGSKVTVFGPTPALAGHARDRWTEHVILKTTLAAPVIGQLLAYLPAGAVVDIDPRSIT
jgi:primosomal protein N' (replication factor Y)